MNKYDDLRREIAKLISDGLALRNALSYNRFTNGCNDYKFVVSNYEVWYSKTLIIIENFLPSRAEDFRRLYRNENRRIINSASYTITDALRAVAQIPYFAPWTASICISQQCDILKACLEIFDNRIIDLKSIIAADVFDSEIDAARHLLKKGFLRAAGAICGVVLEKHFLGVANNHNINVNKKSPTIADFNDVFKDVIYDLVEWRNIQYLGDIRNLCDHNKGREPSEKEIEELISGTERVVKEVF